MFHSSLISVKELKDQIDNPKLIILDCSIDKVNESLKNREVKLIPNSLFFDIENDFSDHDIPLPHTLINEEKFTAQAQKLGINHDSIIVLYDRWGIYSSPRAWWMFRVMGHQQVYVLDGGSLAWESEGNLIVSEHITHSQKGDFAAIFNPNLYADVNEVLNSYQNPKIAIIDARGAKRFVGEAPEPRQGVRAGHIPNAKNLPYDLVLDAEKYKTKTELIEIFDPLIADSETQIFSCGSGITASIIAFASYIAGNTDFKIYDGSWSEWGKEELNLPIE